MAFTAQDVKELREITGCGMMDCKKALTETDGDKDKAVELLREKNANATIITTDWDKLSGVQILTAIENSNSIEKELEGYGGYQ